MLRSAARPARRILLRIARPMALMFTYLSLYSIASIALSPLPLSQSQSIAYSAIIALVTIPVAALGVTRFRRARHRPHHRSTLVPTPFVTTDPPLAAGPPLPNSVFLRTRRPVINHPSPDDVLIDTHLIARDHRIFPARLWLTRNSIDISSPDFHASVSLANAVHASTDYRSRLHLITHTGRISTEPVCRASAVAHRINFLIQLRNDNQPPLLCSTCVHLSITPLPEPDIEHNPQPYYICRLSPFPGVDTMCCSINPLTDGCPSHLDPGSDVRHPTDQPKPSHRLRNDPDPSDA